MTGTVVLVRFEHILIPCRLLDTKDHHTFWLVEPVNGIGRQWVEANRVGTETGRGTK